MAKKESKKMLSVREAAEYIGAAASSVRYWLTKGRFPNAELMEPQYGVSYWLIPELDLVDFEKSKPGPKPKSKPETEKPKAKRGRPRKMKGEQ